MKSNGSLLYSLFLVVGDFLALVSAFVAAYILRVTINITDQPIAQDVFARDYLVIFLSLLPFWILIFGLLGLYNNSIYEKRFSEFGRLLIGSFIGMLFVIAWEYVSNQAIFPGKLVPVMGFGLAFIFLVLFRNIARIVRTKLFKYDVGVTNLLIVGNTKIATELVESLADWRRSGYRIIGLVGHAAGTAKKFPDLPFFKDFESAVKQLRTHDIHGIVQTELYATSARNNEVLDFAQTHHIAYRFIPGNSELFVGNIDVELFRSSIPVIAVHQTPLIGWGRIVKRLFDFGSSLLAFLILSPILLILGLLIVIFDPGWPLFRQERITRFNTIFKAFKFRTMKRKYSGRDPIEVFAEMKRSDLVAEFKKAGKLKKDPRISFFGRFLRRFSLDELPQLINIIKGDMSVVGPRAVIPEELKFYKDKSPMLLSIKTGLTGLAQVSGRSKLDYHERAKLDLYYVQNWSFWFDLVIIVKTVRVVFERGGAR